VLPVHATRALLWRVVRAMTTDLAPLGFTDELPDLAFDSRVSRVYGGMELGGLQCSACAEGLGDPVQDATCYVSFDRAGMKDCRTYICSDPAHLREELAWLLRDRYDAPTNVVVHLPAKSRPLPVADEDSDPEFLLYHSLLKLVETMPNTATVDMSGRDGFEHARSKLRAFLAQLGLNRVEQLAQLGRAA
jgi:hypothetical protein